MSRPLKKIGCVLLVGTLANCGGSIEGQQDNGAVGLPGETAGSGPDGTPPSGQGGHTGACCPGIPEGYGGYLGVPGIGGSSGGVGTRPPRGESFGGQVGVGPGGESFGGQVGVPPLGGAGGDDAIGIGGESGTGAPGIPDNQAGQGGDEN